MLRTAILCIATLCASILSARTVSDFFTTAPDAIVRLLPQSVRLDMLDYYHFGSDKASRNTLGGDARILAETERSLRYQLADSVDVQLAMMCNASDTTLAIVETIKTPAPDSRLTFYSSGWQPLRGGIELPSYSDWLTPEGEANSSSLDVLLPFIMVKADFSDDASTLTFSPQIAQMLDENDFNEAKTWIKPEILRDLRNNFPKK